MGHTLVVGGSALATAAAAYLAKTRPVVQASAHAPPQAGCLWRRADPTTGQGLREALRGAESMVVVESHNCIPHGVFLVARTENSTVPGVLVQSPDAQELPASMLPMQWSRLSLPIAWGAPDELFLSWREAGRRGEKIWCPDVGEIEVLDIGEAVVAVAAALHHPQTRTSIEGTRTTLADLASAAAEGRAPRVVPVTLAARRAKLSTRVFTRWAR